MLTNKEKNSPFAGWNGEDHNHVLLAITEAMPRKTVSRFLFNGAIWPTGITRYSPLGDRWAMADPLAKSYRHHIKPALNVDLWINLICLFTFYIIRLYLP